MAMLRRSNWFLGALKSGWLEHSARTAIGTTASLAVARLLQMPEAYWAPITTLIVLQSTLGASWKASKPRFVGTALGALFGGLLATYVEPGMIGFGAAIFVLGLICAAFHFDQSAYRFAGITLTIVMLVTRGQSPGIIAAHRFVEVITIWLSVLRILFTRQSQTLRGEGTETGGFRGGRAAEEMAFGKCGLFVLIGDPRSS